MPFWEDLFGRKEAAGNDLRIIITRHGERADMVLGPGWTRKLRSGGLEGVVSHLVRRPHVEEYEYDPPLTARGENQSRHVGRKLLKLGLPIDYCYSSPAYRSIQTASKILESQKRKGVPINIEPGMFECPAWYTGLPIICIPPKALARNKYYNIDPNYPPVYGGINIAEDEKGYCERSQHLLETIVETHKARGGTILLSGHAASIETLTGEISGRRIRPEQLRIEAGKVDYCNFAILQRDGATGRWSVTLPQSIENPNGGMRSIESTIPLHQPSTGPLFTGTTRMSGKGRNSKRRRRR